MATLTYRNNTYILYTKYEEREAAKSAGFRWSPDLRAWVRRDPPDLERVRDTFLSCLLSLEIKPDVEEALRRLAEKQKAVLSYQGTESCEPVPTRPDVTLSDYQHVGVRFLAEAKRAILGDELGLGKTPQTIVAADYVHACKVVVVAPKSLLPQWAREVARFSTNPEPLQILDRKTVINPEALWLITNYETVTVRADEILQHKPEALIVDEAVRIKNRTAQRTRAVWRLAHGIPHVWLITGTPIRNRPHEVWSLLYALDPDRFGGQGRFTVESGFWTFCRRYLYIYENRFGKQIGGLRSDAEEEFKAELVTRLIRRSKALLNLPPLSRETVYVEMGAGQKKAYRAVEQGFLTTFQEAPENVVKIPNALAQLTRLRQIALDPALCDSPGDSAKTEWLLEWFEDNADDHKIIIFSTFAEYCRRLREALQSWHPVLLDGSMSQPQREKAIADFKELPSCRAIIISAEAGAEGLNLQNADVVIWINKPWTPDLVEQGTARAWRRGQTNPVHEISLVAGGTIDETMETVLARKDTAAKQALAIQEVVRLLKEKYLTA